MYKKPTFPSPGPPGPPSTLLCPATASVAPATPPPADTSLPPAPVAPPLTSRGPGAGGALGTSPGSVLPSGLDAPPVSGAPAVPPVKASKKTYYSMNE